ncbi:ribulose-phosphate 3-epimerase [Amycolatopsis sp. SID8362]|uniref:ribulose-phosphate 3-epimerase n=1 Tax=Amycolatopsis sp. SID8362 TaxID=2690346 RepID=UPI001367EE69|nr:ribulose-phosphate 3-epimerase [Amycolatopsis sp. SID8362]NBH06666.1 ribulose-phosphate 3-epimerase [Amycolatopsis sp. SID8362]NED43363.1 ribulose-phosphate 3-epimerase [Amycolatopsis sp. SID8362]
MQPTAPRPSIVASILPADFSRLGEECAALEAAGVDRVHWDVMDGSFVPNLTVGPDVIACVRQRVRLGFEAHLMVERPEPMLGRWAAAGCETAIVHAEACAHLHRTLATIRELGMRAGVALNPATPLDAVAHVLDLVDLLLVMTVDPGFGGQAYLASMEPKITAARALLDASGREIALEVDGGIGRGTIGPAARAGADTFCVGSALFRERGAMAAEVSALRRLAAAGEVSGAAA